MQAACATGLSPLGCRSRFICTSAVAPPLAQRTHINTASFSGRTDAEATQWREPRGCGLPRQQQRGIACGALDPSHLSNHLDSLDAAAQMVQHGGLHNFALDQLAYIVDHLPLAYERVTLPCSSMNCGDVIYRRCAKHAQCWLCKLSRNFLQLVTVANYQPCLIRQHQPFSSVIFVSALEIAHRILQCSTAGSSLRPVVVVVFLQHP